MNKIGERNTGESCNAHQRGDYIIEMALYAGYLIEMQSLPMREKGNELLKRLQETRRKA